MEDQRTGDRQRETGNGKWGLRRGGDIAERMLGFAVAVVRLTKQLPKDFAGRHVAAQIIRSAVGVAAKEVRETIYWLAFIQRSGWTKADLHAALREAEELASILSASIRTAKARAR